MPHAAVLSGLDAPHLAPITPRCLPPSGRKNAHRGLAACRQPAPGKLCSQVPIASGKNRRLPTMARRSHLLQQTQCHNTSDKSKADGKLSYPLPEKPVEPVHPELYFFAGRTAYALLAQLISVLSSAMPGSAYDQAGYANAARNSLKDLGRGPAAPFLQGVRQPTLDQSLAKYNGDPYAVIDAAGRTNKSINGGAAGAAAGSLASDAGTCP